MADAYSQLRRSEIFVEPRAYETPPEPRRGGIRAHKRCAVPMELTPARGGGSDSAPTELGGGVAGRGRGVTQPERF